MSRIDTWNTAPDNPNWQQAFAKPTPAPQPQKSGISKWLPTIGAAAGGIIAAPFTGGLSLGATLAAIGGASAIGGGLGEFAGEKKSGQKTNWGDIAKQATISGALGAVPLGGAAKAAKVFKTAGQAGEGAAVQGAKPAPWLFNHGQQLEARSGGYSVNAKMPGSNPLDLGGSRNITQIMQKNGIKGGNPVSRLNGLEPKLNNYGSQIDSLVAKNDAFVTKAQRQEIANNYLTAMKKDISTTPKVMEHANNFAEKFVNSGRMKVSGVVANKRSMDNNLINYIKNPDSTLAAEQRAAVPFRAALKDATNNLVKGVKPLNENYHDLATAKAYLQKGAGEMNARGGVANRIAESGPVKSAEYMLGRGAQKISGAPIAAEGAVQPGKLALTRGNKVGELAKQTIGRSVAGGLGATPGTTPGATPDITAMPPSTDQSGLSNALGNLSPTTQSNPQLDAIQQKLLQAALANPKYASQYGAISTMAGKMSSGGDQKLTAANQKDIASVKNAAGLLQAMEDQFAKAGGGRGPVGYATHIPGIGKYINSNLGAYQQTKIDAAVAYAQALAGGGRQPSEAIIRSVAAALPSPEDTPAMARQKLANLRQHLGHRLQTVSSYPYYRSELGGSTNYTNNLLQGDGYGGGSDATDLYSAIGF